jgi:hypothetical protein
MARESDYGTMPIRSNSESPGGCLDYEVRFQCP